MTEIWKDVAGYEGYYEVSNIGRVRSTDREIAHARWGAARLKSHILTSNFHRDGYVKVSLSKDNVSRTFMVHRLVAEAFLPNVGNLPEVNHTDGNKSNNSVANLEWCSRRDNRLHMFRVLGYRGFGSKHQRVECSNGIIYASVNAGHTFRRVS